jgi:hypothetical protein
MTLQALRTSIRIQDLRILFRAREIMDRLAMEGVESAIEATRTRLVTDMGRHEYLQEMLPGHVAHCVPGATETFIVECADGQRFELHDGAMPLLWQIVNLERLQHAQAVRIIHRNGDGRQVYLL